MTDLLAGTIIIDNYNSVYYIGLEFVFSWFLRHVLTVFWFKKLTVFFFYIYWLAFTWKKGFDELEGKVKSQNKNGSKKMNQKDFSMLIFLRKLENWAIKIRAI